MGRAVTKKTLFITNDFGPRAGGIESFIIGLIEHLPYGSTTVYTSAQGDTHAYDAAWLRKYGVRVIRDRAKILLPTPRITGEIVRLIKAEAIETVAFGAAAPLALMASRLRGAGVGRIIALTHGHEVWWSKVFPFTLAMRRIGSSVDVLTYLGEFTRTAIAGALSPKSADAMVKIAPGIDTAHFAPQSSALQLRESLGLTNKKVIVSVGRLVHRKGQDSLIASLPEILRHHPEAHILMVGTGPYLKHLEDLVEKLAVKDSITFIGRIQYADLPRYISVGDVFAMPSRSRLAGLEVEGLGIVYLEASACGLPVIAGKSGGAPDAVLEGETGITVDGRDPTDIARAINFLLDDPIKAKEMGQRGREWIISNWRWEIWSGKFSDLLKLD